jgi:hypothetical protein
VLVTGIPTVAERMAASTAELRVAAASDANVPSDQIGSAERYRAGSGA